MGVKPLRTRARKAAETDEIVRLLKDGWTLVLVRGYYWLINRNEAIYANANSVRSVLSRNPDKWKIDCWTDGPNFHAEQSK